MRVEPYGLRLKDSCLRFEVSFPSHLRWWRRLVLLEKVDVTPSHFRWWELSILLKKEGVAQPPLSVLKTLELMEICVIYVEAC